METPQSGIKETNKMKVDIKTYDKYIKSTTSRVDPAITSTSGLKLKKTTSSDAHHGMKNPYVVNL